nr:MAG TPA: hypothetical protein [Bacteriophage sp.]
MIFLQYKICTKKYHLWLATILCLSSSKRDSMFLLSRLKQTLIKKPFLLR